MTIDLLDESRIDPLRPDKIKSNILHEDKYYNM